MHEWEKSFSFFCPIKVRFSETDAFGHLNNTKAIVYFEEARIEFFKTLGLMEDWIKKDSKTVIVTADIQCNYLKQIYFDERLQAYVKINYIGNSSVDLHYMLKNEKGEICLTGRGTIVQIDKVTGRPKEWDENIKSKVLTTIK